MTCSPESAKRARETTELQENPGPYAYQILYAEKLIARGRFEGSAKGEIEGKIKAILRVLDVRRMRLSEADRDRIRSCMDIEVLDEWMRRAPVARSRDALFARLAEAKSAEKSMAGHLWMHQGAYALHLVALGMAESLGEVAAKVEVILRALDGREVELSEADRDRVRSCTNVAVLDGWLRNAAYANSRDDVFA
ncbi:hypothetical protein ACIBG8_25215 [Nonomuraea sp. NPDC050556]|uniref:hypothetical protein n=1 Tax=Nonomuraea sp. NPDC050556 TaxID=3364369 RepID=UPI0037AE8D20